MVQEMFVMDYSNYFECLYQCKDGTILPVEAKVTNIQYGSQSSSSIIVTVRDITERKRFERDIKAANDNLERKVEERTRNLEEVNTALRVLLKARDEDRMALEEKMVSNVRELVSPYIEKIRQMRLDETQKMYVDIINNNLNDIISPFLKKVKYFNLTPTEIKVANFVKHGKNTKEIAELMNLSSRTVEGHRDSIRRKLNLKKNKANLRTHLFSLD
jgi:DNA-binding CsgD family transcriptional regulator